MSDIISTSQITLIDLIDNATYIYYANDENGKGAVSAPNADTKYIGIYNGPFFEGQPDKIPMEDWIEKGYWSGWSRYVGESGESISIIRIEYAYAKSSDGQNHPNSGWGASVPTLNGGDYLWSRATTYYSDGTISDIYSVSYSGIDGEDGKDAGAYYIETNQEEILKFAGLENSTYSPEIITFKVFNTPKQPEDEQLELTNDSYKLEIVQNNSVIKNGSEYLRLGFTTSSQDNWGNIITEERDLNTVYFNLQNFMSNFNYNQLYIFRFSYLINNKIAAIKILEIRNGVSEDMAKLGIYSNGITAAIQNNKLVFNSSGLTIQKGISFEENGQELTKYEPVFWANESGDLFLKGNIEATGGYFSGELKAATGSFNGSIFAGSGTIGGLTISEEAIYQGGDYNNSLLKIKGTGEIYAQNITLGIGATIENFIQLGSAKILNPAVNNGMFLEAGRVSLSQSGLLKLGNIELNGTDLYNSSIKAGTEGGAAWIIKGDGTASFREIIVDKATIQDSILEIGTVQAVGSLMLFKDSWKIESITNNSLTLSSSIDEVNLNENDIVTDGNDYYTVLSVSGKKVTLKNKGSLQAGQNITKIGKEKDFLMSILGDSTGEKTFAKKNSLTVSEIVNISGDIPIFQTKLVLGDLSSLAEYGASGTGLFAENVFLNGTLTTKLNQESYAGVNTVNGATATKFNNQSVPDNSKIVFWAGSKSNSATDIQESFFQVTEKGSIYAKQGLFTGSLITESVIKGASIHTAKIYGENINGEEAALQIFDANRGIQFIKEDNGENKYQLMIGLNGFYSQDFSSEPFIDLTDGLSYKGNKLSIFDSSNVNKKVFIAPDHIGYITDGSEIASQKINMNRKFDFIVDNNSVFQIQNNAVKSTQKTVLEQNIIFGIENQSNSGILEYQKTNSGYNLFVR